MEFDKFSNHVFSAKEWSAPSLSLKEDVEKQIDSLQLCGRKVIAMKFIGLDDIHTRYSIEDFAYGQLDELPDEERQQQSNYKNIDPNMLFYRGASIDEPLLIAFDDGDVLEIDVPWENVFRMSLNRIPWDIEFGTNAPNIDADFLFSPCIDQVITSVEYNTQMVDYSPVTEEGFKEEPFEKEVVSNIVLCFENGTALRIGGWIDFCEIDCIDMNGEGETLPISFSQLKEGLFNWEDIHEDESIGFVSKSHILFCGPKVNKYGSKRPIKLYPERHEDTFVLIEDRNFLVLQWSLSKFFKHHFYGFMHHFTKDEWNQILDDAEKILSFDSFDDLFDEVVGWNVKMSTFTYPPSSFELVYEKNYMTDSLNRCGIEIWGKRQMYRNQIQSLREWTNLVLDEKDRMVVYDGNDIGVVY